MFGELDPLSEHPEYQNRDARLAVMDSQGIAIRAGHHCAMPVMQHYQVAATTRASFGLYNTRAEVDALAAGIDKVIEVMGR